MATDWKHPRELGCGVFPRTEAIHVYDEWIGYSIASPLKARYVLERKEDEFKGQARFSAGEEGRRREAVRDIAIPVGVTDAFLRLLSKVPMEEGEYRPRIDHTDDYPSIEIRLEIGDLSVRFFTSSQGAGHVPWGLQVGDETFVVRSSMPADALEILSSYLCKDVLDRLADELKSEWSRDR